MLNNASPLIIQSTKIFVCNNCKNNTRLSITEHDDREGSHNKRDRHVRVVVTTITKNILVGTTSIITTKSPCAEWGYGEACSERSQHEWLESIDNCSLLCFPVYLVLLPLMGLLLKYIWPLMESPISFPPPLPSCWLWSLLHHPPLLRSCLCCCNYSFDQSLFWFSPKYSPLWNHSIFAQCRSSTSYPCFMCIYI